MESKIFFFKIYMMSQLAHTGHICLLKHKTKTWKEEGVQEETDSSLLKDCKNIGRYS